VHHGFGQAKFDHGGFRLRLNSISPNNITVPKNVAHFKSGQKWSKNPFAIFTKIQSNF